MTPLTIIFIREGCSEPSSFVCFSCISSLLHFFFRPYLRRCISRSVPSPSLRKQLFPSTAKQRDQALQIQSPYLWCKVVLKLFVGNNRCVYILCEGGCLQPAPGDLFRSSLDSWKSESLPVHPSMDSMPALKYLCPGAGAFLLPGGVLPHPGSLGQGCPLVLPNSFCC